jgi:ABC-2 type transport system permease protein
MSEALEVPGARARQVEPEQGRLPIAGFGVLFWMSVRRDVLSRKTLLFAALFALPAVLAGLVRYYAPSEQMTQLSGAEHAFVFWMIPQALLPLATLLYSTGMIQDEIEEQTLTYLLVRPIARWAIYAAKLCATVALTAILTVMFTTATYVVLYARLDGFGAKLVDCSKTCVLLVLALSVYCALFGLVSLVARRAMMLGVVYIVLFEGIFANVDFVIRRLTVIYYFRVLAARWMELPTDLGWRIDLLYAPESGTCLMMLIGVGLVFAATGAAVFAGKEFRMKTPEGN